MNKRGICMISKKNPSKKEYEEELEKYLTPLTSKRISYRIPEIKVQYNLSAFNFEELDGEIEEITLQSSTEEDIHFPIQEELIETRNIWTD